MTSLPEENTLGAIVGAKSQRREADTTRRVIRAATPVSYTHLDVYKRQDYDCTPQNSAARCGEPPPIVGHGVET